MTPKQVIEHFKTQTAAAEALSIGQSAVANWLSRGTVPMLRQLQYEKLTKGKLKAAQARARVSRR